MIQVFKGKQIDIYKIEKIKNIAYKNMIKIYMKNTLAISKEIIYKSVGILCEKFFYIYIQ